MCIRDRYKDISELLENAWNYWHMLYENHYMFAVFVFTSFSIMTIQILSIIRAKVNSRVADLYSKNAAQLMHRHLLRMKPELTFYLFFTISMCLSWSLITYASKEYFKTTSIGRLIKQITELSLIEKLGLMPIRKRINSYISTWLGFDINDTEPLLSFLLLPFCIGILFILIYIISKKKPISIKDHEQIHQVGTQTADVITESSEKNTQTADVITESSEKNTQTADVITESSEKNTQTADVITESSEKKKYRTFFGFILEYLHGFKKLIFRSISFVKKKKRKKKS